MDSFVLSETFKYLFLLFAEPGELLLDLDEFIFTTEGHLLPLTLASIRTNISSVSIINKFTWKEAQIRQYNNANQQDHFLVLMLREH